MKGKQAMLELEKRRAHPELKEVVAEASRALARLDADRLEELALSCQALNRGLAVADMEQRKLLARQSREAEGDMAVFARVLEATRANLNVMNRLRALRGNRLEYGEPSALGWVRTESGHGDN
jgi:aminopeptidase N